jgi:predicted amidohydrolase YtcJ
MWDSHLLDSRDPRPFANMAAGVNHAPQIDDDFRASQRITLDQMLDAYTINGARAVRQQAVSGKPEQIADTRVTRTVFRGQTVFSQ